VLLSTHGAVDVVSFTARPPSGVPSRRRRADLKRVILELGGKSVQLTYPTRSLTAASVRSSWPH